MYVGMYVGMYVCNEEKFKCCQIIFLCIFGIYSIVYCILCVCMYFIGNNEFIV